MQHETTLLITSPGVRPDRKLSIRACTLVEFDPDIAEAEWLRKYVQREECPINEHFPADLFGVEGSI